MFNVLEAAAPPQATVNDAVDCAVILQETAPPELRKPITGATVDA